MLWWSLAAMLLAVGCIVGANRSRNEYPWGGSPRRRAGELGSYVLALLLILFAIGWAIYDTLAQLVRE